MKRNRIITLAVLGVCCVLATTTGTPDGGRDGEGVLWDEAGGGGRGPGRGPPGRPQPNSCDNIRNLPDSVETLLQGVIANTTAPIDLLPYLHQLTPRCVRFLTNKFEMHPGSCQVSDVVSAVCDSMGSKEVLHTAVLCLAEDMVCQFVEELQNETDCDLGELDLSQDFACSGVFNPCQVLDLAEEQLSTYLTSLSDQDFLKLLEGVDPRGLGKLSCGHIQKILDQLKTRAILSVDPNDVAATILSLQNTDMSHLLRLMPFLPEDFCMSLDAAMIETLLDLLKQADVNFMCGEQPDDDDSMEMEWNDDSDQDGDSDQDDDTSKMEDGGCHRKNRGPRSRPCRFHCGRALLQTLIDDGFNISSIDNRQRLGRLVDCLSDDELIEAAGPGQCRDFGRDEVSGRGRRERAELAERCRVNSDPTEWTQSTIEDQGCAFLNGRPSDRKDITDEVFCAAMTTGGLEECLNIGAQVPGFMRDVSRRCWGEDTMREQVERLGPAAIYSPCEGMKELSKEERTALVDQLKEGLRQMSMEGERGTSNKAACAMMDDLDLSVTSDSREVMERKSMKRFMQDVEAGDIREALGINDGIIPDLTNPQNRHAFDRMKGNRMVKDMGPSDIRDMSTVVQGMKPDDIADINPDHRREIVLEMCSEEFEEWDSNQLDALRDQVIQSFRDYDPEEPFREFTKEIAEDMSYRCLQAAIMGHLLNVSEDLCELTCDLYGDSRRPEDVSPRSVRAQYAMDCLECMGNPTGPLSQEQVDVLGAMLPLAGKEVVQQLTGAVVKASIDGMGRAACMPKETRDILIEKLGNAVAAADTEDQVDIYCSWFLNLPAAKRDLVQDKVNLDCVRESTGLRERDNCIQEMTMEEREELQSLIESRQETFRELVDSLQEPEPSRRRKRENTASTCLTIQTLGEDSILTLTPAEIEGISNVNFEDCINELGNAARNALDWTADQLSALRARYTEVVMTDLCALTSTQLQNMGSLAYFFTESEIECLDNLDADSLSNLGDLGGWTQPQKAAFAHRYLELINHNTAASLEKEDITSLGEFLCGLTADEIGQIVPAKFAEKTADVGKLNTCGASQLEALAQLATHADVHGPLADWTDIQFGDVGVIIVGFSGDDLKTVDPDHIPGWTIYAIEHMASMQLEKLTPDQLRALSREQALGIDEEAVDFSEEQNEALNEALDKEPAADDDDDDGPDVNGANEVLFSLLTLGGAMLFAFL